jgi:hypothetical protein
LSASLRQARADLRPDFVTAMMGHQQMNSLSRRAPQVP